MDQLGVQDVPEVKTTDPDPLKVTQPRRQSMAIGQHPDTRRLSVMPGHNRPSFVGSVGSQHRTSIDARRRPSIAPSQNIKRRVSNAYDDYMKGFMESDSESDQSPSRSERFEDGEEAEDGHQKDFGHGRKGLRFKNDFHAVMYRYTESRFFTGFIMFIIMINTAMLVGQTFTVVSVRAGWYFAALDNVFLGIYIMEVVLKIYVWKRPFFKEGWNILDFTIVVFNVIDFMLPLVLPFIGGFNGAAIFRLLRIFRAVKAIRALRVLRTIRFLSNLQVIMTTLMQSIKSIGAIVLLITLTMYMFAVIGRGLYAEVDPEHFGSLFNAIFTLFQLLTLDDWYEIYEIVSEKGRWHIILYLMLYIVVEYFVFLNLFVAVLVDNFQLSLEAASEAARKKKLKQQESEDDDDRLYGLDIISDDSGETEETEVEIKKTLEDFYPGMENKDIACLENYFRTLNSLEYNKLLLERQQRLLNMIVDICADTNDDL